MNYKAGELNRLLLASKPLTLKNKQTAATTTTTKKLLIAALYHLKDTWNPSPYFKMMWNVMICYYRGESNGSKRRAILFLLISDGNPQSASAASCRSFLPISQMKSTHALLICIRKRRKPSFVMTKGFISIRKVRGWRISALKPSEPCSELVELGTGYNLCILA